MLTRIIPSSGERLAAVGLGTWRTFDVGPSAAERRPLGDVLARFAARGGQLVDSSPMYGRSEAVVGEIASKLGLTGSLFLATKVWTTGREAGIAQIAESRRRLRKSPLDLMQVHNLLDVETHLETLAQKKAGGEVRYVGISHYTPSAHGEITRLLSREGIDFVQINLSLFEREAETRILPLAAERGVAVIANRPFGGGGAFRRVAGRPLPAWAAELECRSWAQFFLKWILAHRP
jgi:diketogulonate reductase-like aldo/keto reductase